MASTGKINNDEYIKENKESESIVNNISKISDKYIKNHNIMIADIMAEIISSIPCEFTDDSYDKEEIYNMSLVISLYNKVQKISKLFMGDKDIDEIKKLNEEFRIIKNDLIKFNKIISEWLTNHIK